MKKYLAKLRRKATAAKAVLVSFLALGPAMAFAAIPTEASDAITALVTDVTTFIGSLWGIVTASVVGFIVIRLFKKGANKAV